MNIKAMKLALEALEGINDEDRDKSFLDLKQFVRLDMATEALRTAIQQAEAQQPATPEPVAHLWQHGETGRTRIVMLGDVWTANDHWCYVGPLVLGSTHPAPGAPDGWQLVPIEPTDEMISAACQDGVSVDGRPVWKHSNAFQAKWKYQQMLAASPAQKGD